MSGLPISSKTFGLFNKEKSVAKGVNDVLPRPIALLVFGALVFYTAVKQTRFESTPHGLDALDDVVDDLDSVCAVGSTSKYCVEHETFSNWHAEHSEHSLKHLEAILVNKKHTPLTKHPVVTSGAMNASATNATRINANRRTSSPSSETETTAGGLRSSSAASSETVVESVHDEHMPLMKQIQKAKCEMCMEPRHRQMPPCAEFENTTSCEEEGSVVDEIDHARCEMCMEPRHRDYPECAKFRSVTSCEEALAEEHKQHAAVKGWAAELASLQVRQPHRAHHVHHVPRSQPKPDQKEDKVVDQIENLGCEMCLEASRRDNPHCMRFLNTPACKKHHKEEALFTIHMHEMSDEHHAWEVKVEDEVIAFRKKLCADPARKAYHACADLLSASTEAPSTSAAPTESPPGVLPTRSLRGALAVAAAATPSAVFSLPALGRKKYTAPAIVSRSELKLDHSLLVDGSVPTVAAITVLRPGYISVVKVPHLVKGFRNQTYEGRSMLMLVYHYEDEEVGKAVHAVADGSRIFAVPLFGTRDEMHSPSSFRFGSWRAEKEGADLIARWDLEAYHGPKRMEMQVRALAHTQRPACVLHESGTPVDVAETDGLELGERTLVGQAKWMHRSWFPFLDQNEPVLTEREKNQLAVLDLPELFVFVGHHTHATHTSTSNVTHSTSVSLGGAKDPSRGHANP